MIIAIFFIAIVTAILMPTYRAWEIRTLRVQGGDNSVDFMETFSFRNIEKIAQYLLKNIIVGVVLIIAKYWFIGITRTKKWLEENWPKVHRIFEHKSAEGIEDGLGKPYSFMRRLILETRAKVRRMKEKVKRDHE
ncbi:MAG: hypothetical protein WCK91_00345 [bacterium]